MRCVPLVVIAVCGTVSSALAQDVEVIFSKKPGHPTAVVPGAVDLNGQPEAVEWKGLAVSPDGSRWILAFRMTGTADHDVGIVSGSGLSGSVLTVNTASGPFVVQEGQPAPFGNATSFVDFIPSGFGRFDSSNRMVFGVRARTTQTGSTTAPDAMRVLRLGTDNVATLAFKQTDLYFNLQDTTISGDETVGNSVGSFHLLNDGRIGSHDSTIGNISSTRRPALTYNRDKFQQINVDSVTGFGGVGSVMWVGMDANSFCGSPSAVHAARMFSSVGSIPSLAASEMSLIASSYSIVTGAAIPRSTATRVPRAVDR